MRAVLMKGKGLLELGEIPDPVPGPGEALVEIEHCGICGSDLTTLQSTRVTKLPRVLGHEFVGTIRAIKGGDKYPFKEGDIIEFHRHPSLSDSFMFNSENLSLTNMSPLTPSSPLRRLCHIQPEPAPFAARDRWSGDEALDLPTAGRAETFHHPEPRLQAHEKNPISKKALYP